jgi:hypothetical protein
MAMKNVNPLTVAMVVAVVLVAGPLGAPVGAGWANDWTMCKIEPSGTVPDVDGPSWYACPNPRIVGWEVSYPAGVPRKPATHAFQQVFIYPQTGGSCRLRVAGVVGSVEVVISNAKNPGGVTVAQLSGSKGALAKGEEAIVDLTPHVRVGCSRLILIHQDSGGAQAALQFAQLEVNNRAVVFKDIEIVLVKYVLRYHRRVEIVQAGGTDTEYETAKATFDVKMQLYRQRVAAADAAQAAAEAVARERRREEQQERYNQQLAAYWEYQQRYYQYFTMRQSNQWWTQSTIPSSRSYTTTYWIWVPAD